MRTPLAGALSQLTPAVVVGRRLLPPLGQYFSRLQRQKPGESIAAPKGHGPPDPVAFPLQTSRFQGTTGRGHDRHRGPLARPTSRCWAKGHAPVVAVLDSREKAVDSIAAPKGRDSWTCGSFACKTVFPVGRGKGHDRPFVDPGHRRRDGGRRPCPVVAVLVASAQADEPIAVPKGRG